MDTQTFRSLYAFAKSHDTITIACEGCGQDQNVTKTRALETIKSKGRYKCRSCGLSEAYAANPRSADNATREKISRSKTGSTRSMESRQKQADARREMFQTPEGLELRQKLSERAAKQHADRTMNHTRRRGLYCSAKSRLPLAFASSYELRALSILELDETIKSIESQHYFVRNMRHRSLDIVVTRMDGTVLCLEIKPSRRVEEPSVQVQIEDSRWYAETQGWEFQVWTEDNLGFTSPHHATTWADYTMSQMNDIDYVAIRKEMGRAKSLRHYHRKKRKTSNLDDSQ